MNLSFLPMGTCCFKNIFPRTSQFDGEFIQFSKKKKNLSIASYPGLFQDPISATLILIEITFYNFSILAPGPIRVFHRSRKENFKIFS